MSQSINNSIATPEAAPKPVLRVIDAVALIVGIVVGAGIFRTPSLVAANSNSASALLLVWVLGGAVSLIGALCYAELATTYPHAGGDYHFLTRAYGPRLSFLFAWARLLVTQTGLIALPAYVIGDYASQFLRLGEYSSSVYAALVVIVLTCVNIIGIRLGTRTHNMLTTIEVLGVVMLIVVGLFFVVGPPPAEAAASQSSGNVSSIFSSSSSSWGLAMVFVLLTYGGWSEAAYVSAELRDVRRQMVRALVFSILLITGLYLLVNLAYLRGLGLSGMAESQAVAADLMRRAFGERGAALVSILICVSALTSANATVFTGARTSYALGRDFAPFSWLGRWSGRAGMPVNALLVQGAVALFLVVLGAMTRKGFETMVEYTAPVFWFFILLIGISLFVLRRKEPHIDRPFRVPLYPLTPLLFCASSAYLLYSSLAYTGVGALLGIAVLGIGALIMLLTRRVYLKNNLNYSEGES